MTLPAGAGYVKERIDLITYEVADASRTVEAAADVSKQLDDVIKGG